MFCFTCKTNVEHEGCPSAIVICDVCRNIPQRLGQVRKAFNLHVTKHFRSGQVPLRGQWVIPDANFPAGEVIKPVAALLSPK